MKPSMSSLYFSELSPFQMVPLFAKHGWHYLELSSEHAHDLVALGNPEQVGERFRRFAERHGVMFLQGHLPLVWYCDTDRSKGTRGWFDIAPESDAELAHASDVTKQWIDIFAAIGIRAAVLHIGGTTLKEAGWPDDAVFERRMAALAGIAAYAASAGIVICLENYPDCDVVTFEEISAFIAGTRASNVALCLDTGHTLVAGVDCVEFILKARGLMRALHIHENDGASDEHVLPYERGTMDWPRVISALHQIGYAGLFNLEVFGERERPMPVRETRLDHARVLVHGMLDGEWMEARFDGNCRPCRAYHTMTSTWGDGRIAPE